MSGQYRVVLVIDDDGAFGYYAPSWKIIVDNVDLATARSICRHYDKQLLPLYRKGYYTDYTRIEKLEINEYGEEWYSTMDYEWAYLQEQKIKEWCELKGINYMDYLMRGEC